MRTDEARIRPAGGADRPGAVAPTARTPACSSWTARAGATRHLRVRDLPALLAPGDVLVVNDTRVLRARVHATRATGGRVEVLFLEPAGGRRVARAGAQRRRAAPRGDGWTSRRHEPAPRASRTGEGVGRRAGGRHGRGPDGPIAAEVPLPPYVARATPATRARRSTRSATRPSTRRRTAPSPRRPPGSTSRAALLEAVERRGVRVATVTLHVGLGTFQPVRAERIDDHPIHAERYDVPEATAAAVCAPRGRAAGASSRSGPPPCARSRPPRSSPRDGLPRAGHGLDAAAHRARPPLPRGGRAAHELPPAALDAARARRRLRRAASACSPRTARRWRAATASTPTATRCSSPERLRRGGPGRGRA